MFILAAFKVDLWFEYFVAECEEAVMEIGTSSSNAIILQEKYRMLSLVEERGLTTGGGV